MTATWRGEGELFVYRDNIRLRVALDLHHKPSRPGRPGRWAGTFSTQPFGVLTPGRGILYLPDGGEADVMVEGFDVVTGRGDFVGIDAPPF